MSIANLKRQNARGTYPSDLDRQQLRRQEYGFIDLAARSTSGLITQSNQEMIWYSWGAPLVQIPVFSKNVVAATAGSMTCVFPSEDADAALATVTFVKAHVGFRVIPRLTDQSNIVTESQDFMRQYSDAEESLANYLETQIYNTVDAAVATTYNSAFVGAAARYPLLANALQVAVAQQPFFLNDAKSIMMADDFSRTGLSVIGDAQLPSYVNQYVNQGAGNNENTAFQFNGYDFGYSRTTVTSAAAVSTGYVMPQGSLAVISRVNPDAQFNRSSESGVRWTVERSELLGGLDMEMMIKDECADMAAVTGNAADTNALVRSYQLGINAAIITPYNTGTNGGIKKFDYLP
tara:strand:- start:7267 stop:8310 length:1044 start_codon:yes stop_codon:yes gene_type:complete